MRLNPWETLCMNNPLRKFIMRQVEFSRFQALLKAAEVELVQARILDVACGSGYSSRLLKQAYHPGLLVGFDLMAEQVALARHEPLDVLFQGDLLQLPLTNECFDAAFGFGVLHHLVGWKQAAAELHRVLRPGGVLLLEEPNGLASRFFRHFVRFAIPPAGEFSFAELKGELSRLGFRLLGQKTIWAAPFQAFLWERL